MTFACYYLIASLAVANAMTFRAIVRSGRAGYAFPLWLAALAFVGIALFWPLLVAVGRMFPVVLRRKLSPHAA